ncbi:MAG: hypothetical protein WAP03_29060 [Methylorubrum rhodinum]|uniref:hypothetical protein n=1 Tax=Methylorubrum rhodinum TaxID=29428 RepID=UPI003BB03195
MGFRRRRQERVELEVRAALAEFASAVEVRLHAEVARSQKTQTALVEAVRKLREDTASRDIEFAQALTSLGAIVEHLGAMVEADGEERRALVDAVGCLTRSVTGGSASVPSPRRERVIGGTVFGGPSDIEILADEDLDDAERGVPSQPKWG